MPARAPFDGSLDASDYRVLIRLATGELSPTPLESTLGDLNDNGALDAGDVSQPARILLGLSPPP